MKTLILFIACILFIASAHAEVINRLNGETSEAFAKRQAPAKSELARPVIETNVRLQDQMKRFLPILFTLFISPLVSAEPVNKFNAIYENCLKKAGETNNTSVVGCSEEASTAAKAEINLLYRKTHQMLLSKSTEDATKFEQSQKSWVIYRNKHCELASEYVGSPMYGYCPMKLNISRVSELQELLGQ